MAIDLKVQQNFRQEFLFKSRYVIHKFNKVNDFLVTVFLS